MSEKISVNSSVVSADTDFPYADSEDSSSKQQTDPVRKISLAERRNPQLSFNIQIYPDQQSIEVENGPPPTPSPNTGTDVSSVGESPGPLVNVTSNKTSGIGLRRNSISLPASLNTLDLEALQNCYGGSQPDGGITDEPESGAGSVIEITNQTARPNGGTKREYHHKQAATNEDTDDDEEQEKVPIFQPKFRSKRKLSIAPLPAFKLNDKEMMANDFDNQSSISNQNSITSINSLASLLKEKMQAFPSMIRKKKKETKDYKIKLFVTILFFIIAFLIGYSYIMYHQRILTKSYFEKIKFSKSERVIRVFNNRGDEILTGTLGTTITLDKPFHCHSNDTRDDGSVCLEWNAQGRLYMNAEVMQSAYQCYRIIWESLGENTYPTDCYDFSREETHWFGAGLTKNADWPFNEADFDFKPFITGDAKVRQFGNAIGRYLISSRGVSFHIDEETPLHIKMNRSSKQFCMKAMNDDFAFVNRLTELPVLSYKICVAEDMRSLHKLTTQQSLWDGLKEKDLNILNSLIDEPVWQVPSLNGTQLTENSIYNYSENIIDMGFMKLGHIFVNELWQENIGDFSVDTERFPTLKSSIDVLHRRGFRIIFTIQPFISTDSLSFKDAVRKRLLIYERHSERSIPALTRYKSSTSAGVLDITNNQSIPWLVDKLNALVTEYQIDAFYVDMGTAYNMPHYYQCHTTLTNPDMYGKLLASSLENVVDFIGVSAAVAVPRPPAFLSLPAVNSSWEGLNGLVKSVLTYGILGYPFILPGPIGGNYLRSIDEPKMLSFYSLSQPPLPPQDLYIRWLQFATFLPAIQFSHLPSEYKSDYVTEIAKELMSIRKKTVIPLLKKYLSQSMNEGLPLVRPLWLLDPHDPACLSVGDEFSVGEELIVAPILKEGHLSREVYLPAGVWKDGVDGSLRKGSRWIHNYRVPEGKVAYFVKMPDNTRF